MSHTEDLSEDPHLASALDRAFGQLEESLQDRGKAPAVEEIGRVTYVGKGIATVDGLPDVESEELLRFPGNRLGMAFDLNPGEIGVVLLDESSGIEAGANVRRTGRVLDVPVGDALIGRVIDPNGRPRDGRGPVRVSQRLPVEREATPIIDRSPVTRPLQTGIKAIDALIPIGRGQRELILGDRQTGKTAIALDTIVNQKNYDVICIYCAIGQRASAIAKAVESLNGHGALEYTVIVVTTGDDPAGLQFVTPYAATSIGEYFMAQGRDVLIVYDDLTNHARAYRELSLLLRRPPGREAFPGDIFYIHSRLLERATHLSDELGGGSLTALPIIETEAQNISAYIPTNLISITDGQVYLSPQLFQQGILPAVDIGRSVSRVGGKAQLPAYRAVAGNLKLTYAQFQELERFSRYGARLDEERRATLERGRRVRRILQQREYNPISPGEQVAALLAVTTGIMDGVPLEKMGEAEQAVRERVKTNPPEAIQRIQDGEKLTGDDREQIRQLAREAVEPFSRKAGDGDG